MGERDELEIANVKSQIFIFGMRHLACCFDRRVAACLGGIVDKSASNKRVAAGFRPICGKR